ncbi:MAG: TonB-dependent receptor plug domain-containing protein [Oligoflexus sp.]
MARWWLRSSQRQAWVYVGLTVSSSLFGYGLAFSQGSVLEGEPPASQAERIEVTGSRIKRTEIEGVSPVIVLDRQELDRSGVSTVGEVLGNLAVSAQGAYATPVVDDPRGTVSQVNLRGLGAQNTLVLLDGRRLPDESGQGIVDLSTIPMAAVERIEVLKDSASAIYGSDAIGGVVNIITKKDFNGSALFGRASTPEERGSQQTDFSYTSGVSRDNFRILTTVNFRKVEPTFYRDREWTKQGLSYYSFPANYSFEVEGAEIQRHPNCDVPQELWITASANGNELCSYNYGATMAFAPKTTQLGLLNNMEFAFNESVSVFSTLRAIKTTNEWNMAPNAGDFTIPRDVALANLASLGLTDVPGNVKLYYRSLPWGLRRWEEENTLLGGTIGLRGGIGATWEWSAAVGHTEGKKDTVNPDGFFLTDQLVNAIALGEFNPFDTNLSNDSLNVVDTAAYQPFSVIETSMQTYNLDFTGTLFSMAGGFAGLAVGVSHTEQGYSKLVDRQSERGNVFGVVEDKGDGGDRSISAAYAELALPVWENLEIQAAVRHDEYSDFGSATNPKLGIRYLPIPELMLRGNVATGFKAPTLRDIYRSTQIRLENLVDTPVNGLDSRELTTEVEIETAGNQDLKEETSFGYNVGIVTEPIDRLGISVDYWYVEVNDIVTAMDPQKVLNSVAEGRSFDEIEITRLAGSNTGILERIKIPVMNLGESEDAGIDTSARYYFNLGSNRFDLVADYSRKLFSRRIPFPGVPLEDILGERGQPEWRSVNTGIWSLSGHSIMLRNNQIGPQESASDPDQTISQFTTYDVQYAWNHPWNGSIALGALNVFDSDFPRDPTERAGDSVRVETLFGPDGRVFYVNLNQVF